MAQANHVRVQAAETDVFSETSIEEVDYVASAEFERFDLESVLIASFKQSFPTRERAKPVMDGEMDSYG